MLWSICLRQTHLTILIIMLQWCNKFLPTVNVEDPLTRFHVKKTAQKLVPRKYIKFHILKYILWLLLLIHTKCLLFYFADEWWLYYGGSIPELQQIAIRVLSQTSSSSGCERNWSIFERIHSKRRNRLEHQRLDDLVFTNYNLRLKFR